MARLILCVTCSLSIGLMSGCSDESTAAGGSDGMGGTAGGGGGSGGASGAGGEPTLCESNIGGSGGALGAGGSVEADAPCVDDVCPCTEAGIRAAVHAGGGPYTFDCDGPTTIAVNPMEGGFLLDRDVSLDGEGKLTVLFGFFSAPANAWDRVLTDRMARGAVHTAMAGKTDTMMGFWNVPISTAIKKKTRQRHLERRARHHRPAELALVSVGARDERASLNSLYS